MSAMNTTDEPAPQRTVLRPNELVHIHLHSEMLAHLSAGNLEACMELAEVLLQEPTLSLVIRARCLLAMSLAAEDFPQECVSFAEQAVKIFEEVEARAEASGGPPFPARHLEGAHRLVGKAKLRAAQYQAEEHDSDSEYASAPALEQDEHMDDNAKSGSSAPGRTGRDASVLVPQGAVSDADAMDLDVDGGTPSAVAQGAQPNPYPTPLTQPDPQETSSSPPVSIRPKPRQYTPYPARDARPSLPKSRGRLDLLADLATPPSSKDTGQDQRGRSTLPRQYDSRARADTVVHRPFAPAKGVALSMALPTTPYDRSSPQVPAPERLLPPKTRTGTASHQTPNPSARSRDDVDKGQSLLPKTPRPMTYSEALMTPPAPESKRSREPGQGALRGIKEDKARDGDAKGDKSTSTLQYESSIR